MVVCVRKVFVVELSLRSCNRACDGGVFDVSLSPSTQHSCEARTAKSEGSAISGT